ncbi:TPA: hypothetical protein QDB04_000128 [Burkholderia vietnamiensis]|nr:hypothetical protein [Burkholderia vietnamiensis]
MNDKEIVEGAERMARTLLALTGVVTDEPSLRNSRDVRVVPVWRSVAMLLETYNGTNLAAAVKRYDRDVFKLTAKPDGRPIFEVHNPLQELYLLVRATVDCWDFDAPAYRATAAAGAYMHRGRSAEDTRILVEFGNPANATGFLDYVVEAWQKVNVRAAA